MSMFGHVPGPIEASYRSRAVAARRRMAAAASAPKPVVAQIVRPFVKRTILSEGFHVADGFVGPRLPTPKQASRMILEEIAAEHDVSIAEIIGPSRLRRVIQARHKACFRLHIELKLTLEAVGRILGGRDHTTVLHAVHRYAKLHPEYGNILRSRVPTHSEVSEQTKAAKAEAIRIVFDQGLSIWRARTATGKSASLIKRWIAAEAARRAAAARGVA